MFVALNKYLFIFIFEQNINQWQKWLYISYSNIVKITHGKTLRTWRSKFTKLAKKTHTFFVALETKNEKRMISKWIRLVEMRNMIRRLVISSVSLTPTTHSMNDTNSILYFVAFSFSLWVFGSFFFSFASFYAMEIMHIIRLVYDVQSADSGAYKAQH